MPRSLLETFDEVAEAACVRTCLCRHGWLSMLDTFNATCAMECWSPEELPNLSFAHPWASSPAFIIPWHLFGIRATSPGWTTFAVRPAPGSLTHGNISMHTVRGTVAASFARDDARFELRVSVPGGITLASLIVPVPASCSTLGHGSSVMALLDGEFVAPLLVDGGSVAEFEVGAGNHEAVLWCGAAYT